MSSSSAPSSTSKSRVKSEKKKKFACQEENCSKSFSWESELARHTESHTKDYGYKCPKCDTFGLIKGNIVQHMLKQHAPFEEDELFGKSKEELKTTVVDLKAHLRKRRFGDPKVCSNCSTTVSRNWYRSTTGARLCKNCHQYENRNNGTARPIGHETKRAAKR